MTIGRRLATRSWLFTVVVACLTGAAVAAAQEGADTVIARGAPLGSLAEAPFVELSDAVADVEAYVGRAVTVEGRVTTVCQMKGCWMELSPDGESAGVRVTFKDYGFFVPTDSAGRLARLEGRFETNVFSKADADHLIAEGVSLVRNPDGTATEVSFVADGVELRTTH